jgi:hypothetical protein
MVRKQGPWGLWWLVGITAGVYYVIWYARINRELSAVLGIEVPSDGQWWAVFVPVFNLIGLARTATRLNEAHARMGSGTRVSPFMAWFLAPVWYQSQTRYLQRRMNVLADVLSAREAQGAQAAAVAATPVAPVAAQAV